MSRPLIDIFSLSQIDAKNVIIIHVNTSRLGCQGVNNIPNAGNMDP